MIYPLTQLTKPSITGKNEGHILLIVTVGCLALFAAKASAVTPAPDGGYPGGNTAEGTDALLSLSSGTNNTAIGADALANNVSGNDNTAVGFQALLVATGNNNTAVGSQALFFDSSGHDNTATGFEALLNNTMGISNTANGVAALRLNKTGDDNTAVGISALEQNNDGGFNTAVGASALTSNTSGGSNTAVGLNALFFNTIGSDNTAHGVNALLNNVGGVNNSAHGAFALTNNKGGGNNTAVGFQALKSNTSGSNNIALGSNAGTNLNTGSNNIDIGAPGTAGESAKIRIGKQGTHNGTFIAGIFGASVSGSQVLVNSNGKLGVATSSARFKEAIKPMGNTSEAILALKPVAFRYKKDIDPDRAPQFGLIAEEVAKVDPDLVGHDDEGKVNTVRYEAVNAMLLNEFLKEHRKVEEQQATIKEMKAAIARQEQDIKALATSLRTGRAGTPPTEIDSGSQE